MLNYTDTLIVVGLGGEQYELTQCRIDNNKVVYTKNLTTKVQSGSKIIRKYSDGYEETYFVMNVGSKPTLNGTIEIQITPV